MEELSESLERIAGYLSVSEAARALGVSERAVYGYVEAGKLPGARIGNIIVVPEEALAGFERRAPGRVRNRTPAWHVPPVGNFQYVTTITMRVRPGQSEALEEKCTEFRTERKHCFPGTAARYIVRNQRDPDEIDLVLVWRSATMPPEEVREASAVALAVELADVLEWETAVFKEGQVLLHA